MKVEQTGHKYYDFFLHYINIGTENPVSRQRQWRIYPRLHLTVLYSLSETAQSTFHLVGNGLASLHSSIEKLNASFNFLIDFAPSIPSVLGASFSPN